ncbi:cilia- and flagella-associated protein HOATZ isoform X2 [Ornithorhynchus anatinus]|uniref:cilia- and flagella-associated protein HOATZ isoform X2 n=1 Tax=Ornithorhynchus anatinus TaxID=9258 RepID=UPI0010A75CBE|nr:cilia- and flagella-associated protein HOATZ isoform X2 [Ornithorhynchus anatinus]
MATGRSRGRRGSAERSPGSSADETEGLLLFAGSSARDVTLAKTFWLSEAGPGLSPPPAPLPQSEQVIVEAHRAQEEEAREWYFQKAKRREDILALLRKQREDRIRKEQLALRQKPSMKVMEAKMAAVVLDGEEQQAWRP